MSTLSSCVTNFSFYKNATADVSDKEHKTQPIINDFNAAFMNTFSNEVQQNIDEDMTKFHERSSLGQYLQLKTIK